jgi:hypothetical protein
MYRGTQTNLRLSVFSSSLFAVIFEQTYGILKILQTILNLHGI